MSIFAALCVHIHNRAKDGQSLNTCTIWTNIDNSGKRHTLKKLQARARYGQRGQSKTDTPPVAVSIFAPLCVHILNSSTRRVKKSSTRRGGVSFAWRGGRAGSAPRRLFIRVNVLRPKQAAPLIWTTWTISQPESRKALRTAARYDMDNVDKIRTTSKRARGIRRLLSPDVLDIHAAPGSPPRIGTTQTNTQTKDTRKGARARRFVLHNTRRIILTKRNEYPY